MTCHVEHVCLSIHMHHLMFITHAGDLILRLMSLNSQICSVLRSNGHCYVSPAGPENPFNVYDYLRTFYPEEHTTVMELYASIKKG